MRDRHRQHREPLHAGSFDEWRFAYVVGIRQQPGNVGWRRALIAPNPGEL
jgi:hypothetical protein